MIGNRASDERHSDAVSPVVAVGLLVFITMLVSVGVMTFVFGISPFNSGGDGGSVQAAVDISENPDGSIDVTYHSNNNADYVTVRQENGTEVKLYDIGDSTTVPPQTNATVIGIRGTKKVVLQTISYTPALGGTSSDTTTVSDVDGPDVNDTDPGPEPIVFENSTTTTLSGSDSGSSNPNLPNWDFENGDFSYWDSPSSMQIADLTNGFNLVAESTNHAHGSSSSVKRTFSVDRATLLNFHWRVSSEGCCDKGEFYLDGSRLFAKGNFGWRQEEMMVSSGTHTLEWRYKKDGSISSNADQMWMDELDITENTGVLDTETITDIENMRFYETSTHGWVVESINHGDGSRGWVTRQVTFDNATKMSFEWYLSAASGDRGYFYINGVRVSSLDGDAGWNTEEFAFAPGTYTFRWKYQKDSSGTSGSDILQIDHIKLSQPLTGNMDKEFYYGNVTLTNDMYFKNVGGSRDFIAISNNRNHGSQGVLRREVNVSERGMFTFDWYASSERCCDKGKLYIDGSHVLTRAASSWRTEEVLINSGKHTIEWHYDKDGSVSDRADELYTDNFKLIDSVGDIDTSNITDIENMYLDNIGSPRGVVVVSNNHGHGSRGWVTRQYTFNEPTRVTWEWETDSASGDEGRFYINGELVTRLPGNSSWSRDEVILAPGTYTLRWDYNKDGSGSSGADVLRVDEIYLTTPITETMDPEFASDRGTLTMTNKAYYKNMHSSRDYIAISANHAHGSTSAVKRNVSLAERGMVVFDWYASSERCCDKGKLYSDGSHLLTRAASSWRTEEVMLDGGSQTLNWEYSKDGSVSDRADKLYMDNVTIITTGGDIDTANISAIENALFLDKGTTRGYTVHTNNHGSNSKGWVKYTYSLSETTLVTYDLELDSEANDRARIYVDGKYIASVNGNTSWLTNNVLLQSGTHSIRLEYDKDSSGSAGDDKMIADGFTTQPSASDPDDPSGVELTGTSKVYLVDNGGPRGLLAYSKNHRDSSTGWMTKNMTVSSSTTVSFDWYVSSEGCCDKGRFYVDGSKVATNANGGWNTVSFTLSSGTHELKWEYAKDGSVSSGSDRMIVDDLNK